MKLIISILCVLGFGLSSQAVEVDTKSSEFKWTGKKVTGQHYGKLPVKSATLKAEKGKVTGGTFVLDITNMTVEDLSGDYKKKFLTHMKSKDFFEVSKWPTAQLVIEKIKGNKAFGKLTIKDKTNDVVIPFKKTGNTYAGTLKFDRTKYNMIYGSGDFFKNLGDKMIYNDVTLDFKVVVLPEKNTVAKAKK